MTPHPLPPSFYAKDAVTLAQDLLGCLLVRRIGRTTMIGRIVETEAYSGAEDKASHGHGGLRKRNAPMFGPAGRAYVYFIYGTSHCFNVVGGREGEAEAVLIRAVEPILGLEAMQRRRKVEGTRLTNGPGKLCQALGIDASCNDRPLSVASGVWIAKGAPVGEKERVVTTRIGLGKKAGSCALRPWRFYLKGNAFVSHPLTRQQIPANLSQQNRQI